MQIVDDPEAWLRNAKSRGREKRTYPWDRWSDGRWREAVKGHDFDCSPHAFATAAYRHAAAHGKKAAVVVDGLAVLFRMQADDG